MSEGPTVGTAKTGGEGTDAAGSAAESAPRRPVLLVTGLSGAGRSTTLKMLEDLSYDAVDNLPLSLIEAAIHAQGEGARPIALGCDIRARDFDPETLAVILRKLAADPRFACDMLFLDCDDDALRRRFTETRRRHPLAQDRPVTDGIAMERRLLMPLRALASLVIDTTSLPQAQLRRILLGRYGQGNSGMQLTFVSFAYREGLPREADLVFDARFLRNPHYEDHLRPLTGRDPAVAAYVATDPAFAPFLDGIAGLLTVLLPRYADEGKCYLTIAIGCTGGRHRSVAIAERLAQRLQAGGWRSAVVHRELAGAGGENAETSAAQRAAAFLGERGA